MKSSLLLISILVLFIEARAQSQIGLEQYYYFGNNEDLSLVTVGYVQNAHNWYGEVRYNYEERKTMSIYAGKTFYGEGKFSYAATPVLGLLIGRYNGGAIGANLEMAYEKMELSSQTQYLVSKDDRSKNFVLNWTEFSYQIIPAIKSGIVLQQSTGYQSAVQMEAGGFLGFSYKNWEFPIYVFSPLGRERNYVVGISWEWQHNNAKNRNPGPLLKGRRNLAVE